MQKSTALVAAGKPTLLPKLKALTGALYVIWWSPPFVDISTSIPTQQKRYQTTNDTYIHSIITNTYIPQPYCIPSRPRLLREALPPPQCAVLVKAAQKGRRLVIVNGEKRVLVFVVNFWLLCSLDFTDNVDADFVVIVSFVYCVLLSPHIYLGYHRSSIFQVSPIKLSLKDVVIEPPSSSSDLLTSTSSSSDLGSTSVVESLVPAPAIPLPPNSDDNATFPQTLDNSLVSDLQMTDESEAEQSPKKRSKASVHTDATSPQAISSLLRYNKNIPGLIII